ncbi:MAG: flagellar basal-body rod protein FlgF [Deltaproteobacteria bacterium]|nr:flagellar basal-body rod protein FlgF [Deltaproteobacteria bacterium]
MDRGIYMGVAGGIVQSKTLDIITSNLAGSNVAGFKKDLPVFNVQFLSQLAPSSQVGGGSKAFVNIDEVATNFSQGVLTRTGNPVDVAISGDGFFVVEGNNERLYTRRGDFTIDAGGFLATKGGNRVFGDGGPIALGAGEIVISEDGTVTVNGENTGQLSVVTFPEPYAIRKVSGGLFAPTGEGSNEVASENATILQGRLESSNVSAVKEMVAMINALRAYESHMKLIKGFDDITGQAIKMANR